MLKYSSLLYNLNYSSSNSLTPTSNLGPYILNTFL